MTFAAEATDRALAANIRDDLAAGCPVTIMCSPTTEKAHVDSMTAFCSVCNAPVWLSRRIAAELLYAAKPHTLLCVPCGLGRQAAMN